MKRLIQHALSAWRNDASRKSLLVRGARQVGKTFAIRQFAKGFPDSVEVNFEKQPALAGLFDADLDPRRILRDLQLATGARVRPGKTLLFLDEIQAAPRALTALRYFHEDLPELHVVAAGSLIEFSVAKVGIPVGRVPRSSAGGRSARPRDALAEGRMKDSPVNGTSGTLSQLTSGV